MRLRYDYSTKMCRDRFARIEKLGKIKLVRGYRYFGRYNTSHEAVLVVGENGTARFGGLLWGYGGEGPRGLQELLLKLNVPAAQAEAIAFSTPRKDEIGEDGMHIVLWHPKTETAVWVPLAIMNEVELAARCMADSLPGRRRRAA